MTFFSVLSVALVALQACGISGQCDRDYAGSCGYGSVGECYGHDGYGYGDQYGYDCGEAGLGYGGYGQCGPIAGGLGSVGPIHGGGACIGPVLGGPACGFGGFGLGNCGWGCGGNCGCGCRGSYGCGCRGNCGCGCRGNCGCGCRGNCRCGCKGNCGCECGGKCGCGWGGNCGCNCGCLGGLPAFLGSKFGFGMPCSCSSCSGNSTCSSDEKNDKKDDVSKDCSPFIYNNQTCCYYPSSCVGNGNWFPCGTYPGGFCCRGPLFITTNPRTFTFKYPFRTAATRTYTFTAYNPSWAKAKPVCKDCKAKEGQKDGKK